MLAFSRLARTANVIAFLVVGSLAGCSSSSTSDAATEPAAPAGECVAGATRCAGLQVQTCDVTSATPRFGDPADCSDGQVCRDGKGCTPLTADETKRVSALAALFAESKANAARPAPVDYAALDTKFRAALLAGDDSPQTYVQTMWDALMSLPQGHQALWPAKLDDEADVDAAQKVGFVMGPITVYGTCMAPYLDHAVVTQAATGSPLRFGDEVVAIDGQRGADLQAHVIRQPDGLDLIPPTATGRFAFAVRSFLGRDRKDAVLTVKRAGAAGETPVTLPAGGTFANASSCSDPFGRDASLAAIGSVLPDGTGVLYLPSFQEKNVAAFEAAVGPEFDKVKDAPRLVIDLRGNTGGSLSSALDLVAQLPGAKKADYCEFFDRTPLVEPPAYVSQGKKTVSPETVPPAKRFAYSGRVALLVDGGTFSAAEHFVLAARAATSILVIGTKTAGSYGNTSNDVPKPLAGTPALQVTVNRSQVRTVSGEVLDGVSQEPDIIVEYEPATIAAHEDPMMKRAITELSK